ncbi:MAG: hypothetical protein LBK40_03165 [Spirochaetaceae bacterium]|nr:hypothetical protein [Spirochaetaceae bacterium]
MEVAIELHQSALKHGISEADIKGAIKNVIYDDIVDGFDDKHLLLGFDSNGNLLEILYNFIDEQSVNVFHAMKCRKAWRSLASGQAHSGL